MLANLIADSLNIKVQDIYLFDNVLDLHPQEVRMGAHYAYDYNEQDTKKIEAHFRKIQHDKEVEAAALRAKRAKEHEEYIKQQIKDHPLVKDKRCFNLNWWPDIVPDCYKGGDFED